MRIVYLCEVLGIGGLPNYVIQLVRSYVQAHPDTEAIIAHMGDSIGENLEVAGLQIVRIQSAREIAALKPDLIHVHLLSDNQMIEDLLKLGIPLIRSFHDYTSTCLRRGKRRWPGDRCQRPVNIGCAAFGCIIAPPKGGRKIPSFANLPAKIAERDLYTKFDASITGSQHMTGMLLKNGFPAESVHTIPYFSRFADDALNARPKQPRETLELLFTGQAVAGKGLEILIESLGGVKGAWHLTVFSEGPRLGAAKEKAEALNIAQNISFKGWVNQSALREAYQAADVFVLPSIWDDPGPLVGIEAMAMGTPVIGFAVGGIPDYVLNGKTGFLVRDISVGGLRAAIQSAIDNSVILEQMGIDAANLVATRHSANFHIDAMHKVYSGVVNNFTSQTRARR